MKKRTRRLSLGKLIGAILLCEGAGILGTAATAPAIPLWYTSLQKPFFTPPAWVFGPAWTILYFLMGIALYRVWMKKNHTLFWFWVQLVLNVCWSIIFFGLHRVGLALIEIILLEGAILQTIREFRRVDTYASRLLYPYALWVAFASLLTFGVWLLNK